MSYVTNQLVDKVKKALVPASVAATVALGVAMFVNHNSVAASSVTASPLDDHSVAALTSLDNAMESVAARVTPAVVNIAVTSKGNEEEADGQQPQTQGLPPGFAQFFGFGQGGAQPQQPQVQHGIGSGVIISPDGYIVTNDHVVDGATQIKVTLHDRRILTGKVVGVDKLTDLAVVKVNATDLPAIAWGDSGKLEPGQTVLAFGSPFGYFQFSVTRGIVSAVDRPNPYSKDARKPGGYIQTDAAINPGNSGGPLVNAHGELVGINTFIISDSGSFAGAGFAIPSQMVHSVATELIANGKVEHGYLGISMNDVTPENAHFFNLQDATGTIVAQVTPDSPAANAGLQQGDVINELNGQKILNGSALQVAVSEDRPGTKIALGVMRNGKSMTLNLTVGEFHSKGDVETADADGGTQHGKLGLSVADLTAETRQQINAPDQVHGVLVQSVRPDSPADDAGLQPGDVILEVDRKPATSASAFVSEMHNSPAGKDLLLLVWSRGNASYRTVHPADQNGELLNERRAATLWRGGHFLFEAFAEQVVGDADGVGDDGQRRIHGTGRNKTGGIDNVEVIEVVRLAVCIEHARGGIITHAAGAILVADTFKRDALLEVGMQWNMRGGVARALQHIDPPILEPVEGLNVVGRIGKLNPVRCGSRNRIGLVGAARIAGRMRARSAGLECLD
jgi:serine protease Do